MPPRGLHRWVLLVVVLGLTGSLALSQPAGEGQKYALLIGVSSYEHQKLPNLPAPENDIEDLAAELRQAGYHVTVLTTRGTGDGLPTGDNIRARLDALLLGRQSKRDLVLIALEGHGVQLAVKDGDREKPEAFFCPSDANPTVPGTMLGMSELFKQLDRSGAGTKLVLVDACRNDPTVEHGIDSGNAPRPPRGAAALFSCDSGQRGYETKKLSSGKARSIFFHYVLEGLRGAARNGQGDVTWGRLVEYVKEQVSRETPKLLEDAHAVQEPNDVSDLRGLPPILARVAAGEANAADRPSDGQAQSDMDLRRRAEGALRDLQDGLQGKDTGTVEQIIAEIEKAGGFIGGRSVLYSNKRTARTASEPVTHVRFKQPDKCDDKTLAMLKSLVTLEYVDLDTAPITDAGLAHLKGLTNLQVLRLQSTRITDEGLVHLQGLKKLKQLFINNTRVTQGGIQDLQRMLPNVEIVTELSF